MILRTLASGMTFRLPVITCPAEAHLCKGVGGRFANFLSMHFYAPNFEGAYCFGLVRQPKQN